MIDPKKKRDAQKKGKNCQPTHNKKTKRTAISMHVLHSRIATTAPVRERERSETSGLLPTKYEQGPKICYDLGPCLVED